MADQTQTETTIDRPRETVKPTRRVMVVHEDKTYAYPEKFGEFIERGNMGVLVWGITLKGDMVFSLHGCLSVPPEHVETLCNNMKRAFRAEL